MTKQEIQKLVDSLNEFYPTSYDKRFNHAVNYFSKKAKIVSTEKQMKYITSNLVNDKVRIEYTNLPSNVVANAQKLYNIIQLDVEKILSNVEFISGYKKEQEIMVSNVKNFNQYLRWVIIHEYVHLLYPELGHIKEFYKLIEQIFNDSRI